MPSAHFRSIGWDNMTTSNAALPHMAKISMIGLWIETLLYGVNCAMYGLCMFTVLRGRKIARLRWMLIVVSTILFFLCTMHVGASLQQLLDAFVYAPADIPNYSTTYWLDFTTIPSILKGNLYASLVLVQDIILIWRLYAVFMCNWKVIIFPIILTAGCVGSAYAASAVFPLQNNGLFSSLTTSLIIVAWAFGFTLNVSVSGAIVIRLWRMGRTIASLTATSTNRFTSSIYMVIESGAISAVTNAIMLALFASSSPAALSGMDVASQMLALAPLLIVVQVGQTDQHTNSKGDYVQTLSTARFAEMSFRAASPKNAEQDLV